MEYVFDLQLTEHKLCVSQLILANWLVIVITQRAAQNRGYGLI